MHNRLARLVSYDGRILMNPVARHVSTSVNPEVFDKQLRIKHLDIAAKNEQASTYDYIRRHVAKELCDRVSDLMYKEPRNILNIGSCSNFIAEHLEPDRVNSLIHCDISRIAAARSRALKNERLDAKFFQDYVHCDEERLPFRRRSMDLVTSCLTLHWVNDLVGCFTNVYKTLKPNSAFIGCMFGGDTLFELRSSLQLAEIERLSSFASHVAPKTTGQDVGRLLQHTKYQLITVDVSEIKIRYPTMFELMFDLQGMGENNASIMRCDHIHREVLQSAAAIYHDMHGDSSNVENGVPATFQIIHFIGWKKPV